MSPDIPTTSKTIGTCWGDANRMLNPRNPPAHQILVRLRTNPPNELLCKLLALVAHQILVGIRTNPSKRR